ncbi:hypothetical protein COO91_09682 (plasmid) [Nostoc flagelliforme CCNUN1]|uniref:Uncharacterized protein n=1 Tax=Nostoc flagelliforme CCNUN1 TaxID=2038116 RepID=A0A2K8T623_9NOSO|nr:hypothetical protein COO91_09088 [Nostoc flagelliforme CCNUN1]AUB43144.1 hypothetical protein COO91_09308 [Nostoc flagelliforme CCNUN1]AUB43501.1 hypothetical protein COO91_09682 [Nostoc flagelliforme CCNUN1]
MYSLRSRDYFLITNTRPIFSNSIACIHCLMRLLAIALTESDKRGL